MFEIMMLRRYLELGSPALRACMQDFNVVSDIYEVDESVHWFTLSRTIVNTSPGTVLVTVVSLEALARPSIRSAKNT